MGRSPIILIKRGKRVKKNLIYNLSVILFAIIVFCGIGFIIYRDVNKLQKHLDKCKKQCYPALVVEQFSRKHCFCQTIEEVVNE